MGGKPSTRDYCSVCGSEAYVDTWRPGPGLDPDMRRFVCSNCGNEDYRVVKDKKLLGRYDRQLARR